MASIVKRKNSYSVVYYVERNNGGSPRQIWETYKSYKEALRRKAQVENQIFEGAFSSEGNQTMSEFLWEFVSIYGEKKWSLSTYDGNIGLITNYIEPLLGSVKILDVTPKMLGHYYKQLKQIKSVIVRNRKPKNEFLSNSVIEKVHKLLKTAFTQAVKWEMIDRNPAALVDVEKTPYQKRDIWTPEMIATALHECEDPKLYLAINLAFACCLREGEILGLQWDRVHISDGDIVNNNAQSILIGNCRDAQSEH
ncbi:MAG: site-specific integrase [Christensenellaceae bacterium]|jgi:integrase